jgi:hypothetical protein
MSSKQTNTNYAKPMLARVPNPAQSKPIYTPNKAKSFPY